MMSMYDKIVAPISFRVFPVDKVIQGLRTLINSLCNRYLIYTRKCPPDILYRSDNYLIINKAFDVKINSDISSDFTVATHLKDTFPELVENDCTHHFRFAHRLDYPTSGALCLALNKKAAAKISKLFMKRNITKHYLALVGGYVSEQYILVDVPIGRNSLIDWKNKMCSVTDKGCIDSRSATTLVILLEHGTYGGLPISKVLLIPYTGRTHQLRVHCNLIGHTILGDYTYSNEKDTEPYRMMLHAYRLVVPVNNEHIDIITNDPFVQKVDSKWKPHKVYMTYEDAASKNFTLQTIEKMNIFTLRYHTMKIMASNGEVK